MSIGNLCIVKFRRSGKYAIRKGFFIHMYFDFDSPSKLWWKKDDDYFEKSCLIDSLEVARRILKELKEPNSNFKNEEVVER